MYGAMSFLDKMSNGIVIQIIQVLYPKSSDQRSDFIFLRASVVLPDISVEGDRESERKIQNGGERKYKMAGR